MGVAANFVQQQPGRSSGQSRALVVNKAAAMVLSSGKLTLLQRKLSNALLLNAYDALATQSTHRISVQNLCALCGYNSNDRATLGAALKSLQKISQTPPMSDEQSESAMHTGPYLSFADIKSGVCEYAYPPAIAKTLYRPVEFAAINLDLQQKFTSGHALALYESCRLFWQVKSTGWWSVDRFRRFMGIEDSDYYKAFKHLNAKIVKPSIAEINSISDISLSCDVHKQNRIVSHIRFRLQDNPKFISRNEESEEIARNSQVYDRLLAHGVPERQARQWISELRVTRVPERLIPLQGLSDMQDAGVEGERH